MLKSFSLSALNCFSEDYISARKNLLEAYRLVSPRLQKQHQSYQHPLPGPTAETLTCDTLYIGSNQHPQHLLVLISATHGVEGFAGSALQTDFLGQLEELLEQHKNLGVMLIHAVNPWGFAWLRRYDHQGIDLNRNFIDFKQALPANQEFDNYLPKLLNPDIINPEQIHKLWENIDQEAFIDTVARGQYCHDTACFYGGKKPSWSRTIIQQITSLPQVRQAKRLAVIDLHSGLGPYGYGEVINDHPPATTGFNYAHSWYGNNAQSVALGDGCSTVKTGLIDYHWHSVIGERGCFVTLEFGTYPLKQLWISVLAEQIYNNEAQRLKIPRDLQHSTVIELKKFFYPAERSWQEQVIFRGRQIFDLAISGMMQ